MLIVYERTTDQIPESEIKNRSEKTKLNWIQTNQDKNKQNNEFFLFTSRIG